MRCTGNCTLSRRRGLFDWLACPLAWLIASEQSPWPNYNGDYSPPGTVSAVSPDHFLLINRVLWGDDTPPPPNHQHRQPTEVSTTVSQSDSYSGCDLLLALGPVATVGYCDSWMAAVSWFDLFPNGIVVCCLYGGGFPLIPPPPPLINSISYKCVQHSSPRAPTRILFLSHR